MRSEGARLLSQVQDKQMVVAERVGVSQTTISMWCSGHRVPKPVHREALSKAYGIPKSSWPDGWNVIKATVIRRIAERDPELLEEIVNDLSSML